MLDGVVGWPPELAHRYRARGYWAGTTIGQAWDRAAGANADRVALVDGARRVTYRALSALVDRLAVHLALRGVRGGARAILQLPNTLELVVAYLACLKVGAIPVPCPPAAPAAEVADLARLTEAAAWFVGDELRGAGVTRLADLLADPVEARTPPGSLGRLRPRPDDVAVFQLAGGTTGRPRVIPRTHDDYLYGSLQVARVTDLERESVLLVALPAAHHVPLACPGLQAALLLGARVVLAPSADPETVFPLVEAERVTWIPASPAALTAWLDHPRRGRHDWRSLRRLYVGGWGATPGLVSAAREAFGPVVQQLYGPAEGCTCATRWSDPAEVSVETQGRPVSPDDEIRIVDEAGREVPPGEPGELQCRGPSTIRGYWCAPEDDRVRFTPDGFYRTGDRARLDPSGNLVVEASARDVVQGASERPKPSWKPLT